VAPSDILTEGFANRKHRDSDKMSRAISLISEYGSFDIPVFIGTTKVSKSAFANRTSISVGGLEWSNDIAVSQFAEVKDDDRFREESLGAAKGGHSIPEPAIQSVPKASSISSPSAMLIHHSLQSTEGARSKPSIDRTVEEKPLLLCEMNRLCYGKYWADNACLVVFAFSFVPPTFGRFRWISDAEISIAFEELPMHFLAG
jgi:hypothetical protein